MASMKALPIFRLRNNSNGCYAWSAPSSPISRSRSFLGTCEMIGQDLQFQAWAVSQLGEIRERHSCDDDETAANFLNRAAAAGDEQAKKLLDMGTLDVQMSPIPEQRKDVA
jgi:hypothetical protein